MISIGLDFGSTYTVVSVYKNGAVNPVLLTMGGSPFVPSIVLKDDMDEFEYGLAAKQRTGEPDTMLYKAFKMMMTETEEEKLRERGYDETYTPQMITRAYLNAILEQALEMLKEDAIGLLIVGVPEIWYEEGFETIDCCTKLRDLCQSLDFVKEVQIVSEPAAASAYFAWNYKEKTQEDFCGHILMVDYGGGTLDITLNEVSTKDGVSNIAVKERTGAGENEEGKIGKAGIVYMESVVSWAIEQCLGIKPEVGVEFYQAVDRFEQMLQSKSRKVKDFYQINEFTDLEGLEDVFAKISYMGRQVPITYGLMATVYRRVIEPVLKEKLDLMEMAMERYQIDYKNPGNGEFKIVLVGGFSNFYLTRKQVQDYFHYSSKDKRWKDMIADQTDCDNAISFGAALIANEVIRIPNSAPYSIGIHLDSDGDNYQYAIHYKEEIKYGEPYFQVTPVDEMPKILIGTDVSEFVINWTEDEKKGYIMELKEEFKEKLREMPFFKENDFPIYALGFGLDRSNVLSLYFKKYDDETGQFSDKVHCLELNKMRDVFKLRELKR